MAILFIHCIQYLFYYYKHSSPFNEIVVDALNFVRWGFKFFRGRVLIEFNVGVRKEVEMTG